ncbi:hypothetical protein HELRODRAFT_195134 [Helobdella robusta]|uniref:Isoleucine--tRNA ligase cytoplasmic ubiquitin-like domain-containing protein n=1 Tax=Helobdella robusta TaxID=6412 RepID=T1FWS6_HELRO|nr:hypothetical protein HELRODRAFT_195134 [Helobdella robusta]ESN95607.1 hypothetical protein HELRODRAFT_195134 [Helobdella robusta]
MQAVIDLGRVIRERNVMPIKYPLKEVVVIHKDQAVLDAIISLQKYINEELNVKVVTVTNDKKKYQVTLRAEPDHKILGARLKGDFKGVMAKIKQLTDTELEVFQATGEIEVDGHKLTGEDLRIMYDFGRDGGSQHHFEADSDGEILVLLDTTPDSSMLDEGLAREAINRIQKLRKKASLKPSDDITILYNATGHLDEVMTQFLDLVTSSVKQPVRRVEDYLSVGRTAVINNWDVKDEKEKKLSNIKGDELRLAIIKGHQVEGQGHVMSPHQSNLTTTTTSPTKSQHPPHKQTASAAAAASSPAATTKKQPPSSSSKSQQSPSSSRDPGSDVTPFCSFINFLYDGNKMATVLLENPVGHYPIKYDVLISQ